MDPSTELIEKIKTLNEDECNLFLLLIKNKQQLALLEREVEWVTKYHRVDECDNESVCSKCYRGDREYEIKYNLVHLAIKLFDKSNPIKLNSEEEDNIKNSEEDNTTEIDYEKLFDKIEKLFY